jgi:hypothetical protein
MENCWKEDFRRWPWYPDMAGDDGADCVLGACSGDAGAAAGAAGAAGVAEAGVLAGDSFLRMTTAGSAGSGAFGVSALADLAESFTTDGAGCFAGDTAAAAGAGAAAAAAAGAAAAAAGAAAAPSSFLRTERLGFGGASPPGFLAAVVSGLPERDAGFLGAPPSGLVGREEEEDFWPVGVLLRPDVPRGVTAAAAGRALLLSTRADALRASLAGGAVARLPESVRFIFSPPAARFPEQEEKKRRDQDICPPFFQLACLPAGSGSAMVQMRAASQ